MHHSNSDSNSFWGGLKFWGCSPTAEGGLNEFSQRGIHPSWFNNIYTKILLNVVSRVTL